MLSPDLLLTIFLFFALCSFSIESVCGFILYALIFLSFLYEDDL